MRATDLRAMGWGALLGVPLGLSNLVIGLKLGFAVSVALTAVGFAGVLRRSPLAPDLAPADAALLQSVSSAAGYSAGSATASVLAATLLVGAAPSWPVLLAWTLSVAVFGTLLGWAWQGGALALPFPSATAAAESIQSLWRTDGTARPRHEWGVATAVGLAVTLARRLTAWVPAPLGAAGRWGFGFEPSMLALGIGALLGPRLGLSLALGALLVVGLEGPLVASALGLSDAGALGAWNVWPATALLTAAASTHFVSSLALKQATSMPVRGDALRWALLAGAGAGLVCVFGFDAPWWAALLAVVLAPLACVIVIRMAGETDVTAGLPLAMGLQVLFGLALPFGVGAHLASAGVLAGATATAADQVGDVKTGTLVGLEPRRQLVGQLLGCVVGSVVAVAGFVLLTAGKVGDARWPVPAAQQFLALGRAASGEAGLDARLLVAVGGAAVVGLLLALLERTRWVRWLPSPMGLGVALLVPPALSLTIGVGAVLGFLLRRRRWLTGAAAGLMVGETVGELVATLRGLS